MSVTAITDLPIAATGAVRGRLRTLWQDLDAPVSGRRVPGTVPVAVVSIVAALAVAAYLVPSGWALAYSDAQSHLTIARRLLDNRSELSLNQLGTVWLPLPHLLLAPLSISLWAWHTGWAAALLGAGCLGVTAAAIYRTMARWGVGRAGRLVAVAALVLNPSMLYLASTALTEPVLIACLAASLAGLANFATRSRLSSPGEVAVFAGLPAALAVLSRYEGWALALTGTLFVAVTAWRRTTDLRKTFSSAIGFLLPPLVAMAGWVGHNWVVFHNPLEFLYGTFSANAQQSEIVASGETTKGNLGATVHTLDLAIGSSVGWGLLGFAAVGLLAALTVQRVRNQLIFLVTAATSYVFLVVALYLGQAVIWNQGTEASYIWNNRFGMASILPAALAAGIAAEALPKLVQRLRPGSAAVRPLAIVSATVAGFILLGQASWFLQAPVERSLVVTEAAASLTRGADSRIGAEWLGSHYDGGGILLDETTWSNAVLPQIGIPLREYYLMANGELFDQAVADPSSHVRWVWASRGATDSVTELTAKNSFTARYQVAFSNDLIVIYTRIGG